jgi:WD40 repeat protein
MCWLLVASISVWLCHSPIPPARGLPELKASLIPVSLPPSFSAQERVACGDSDHVRVLDVAKGDTLFGCDACGDPFSAVALSHNGDLLAVGRQSGRLTIFQVRPAKELANFRAHTGIVGVLAFSQHGKFLASGSDHVVTIWDTTSWEPLKKIHDHKHCVTSFCFSPDNKFFATSCADNVVRIWETQTFLHHFFYMHRHPVCSLSFSADSKRLASVDSTVVRQGGLVKLVRGYQILSRPTNDGYLDSKSEVTRWTGSIFRDMDKGRFLSNDREVIHWSNPEVIVWDTDKKRVERQFRVLGNDPSVVACGPDQTLAVCCGSTILVWDATSDQPVKTLQTSLPILGIHFTSNDKVGFVDASQVFHFGSFKSSRPVSPPDVKKD